MSVECAVWATRALVVGSLLFTAASMGAGQNLPADRSRAETLFNRLCAGCHGESGAGGDRAPGLRDNRDLRNQTEKQIQDIIHNGTPGGMPAFTLPDDQLGALAAYIHAFNASAIEAKPAGDSGAGQKFFFGKGQCANCHMVSGRGASNGPDLSNAGRQLTVREMEQTLDDPTSQMGTRSTATCPGWAFCPEAAWSVMNVRLRDGTVLRGFARSEGQHDLQLQTFDECFHFLSDSDYQEISREKKSFMPPLKASAEERRDLLAYLSSLGGVIPGPLTGGREKPVDVAAIQDVVRPRPSEWPTYNGTLGGNRYSLLDQIKPSNIQKLQLRWSYSLPASGLETTPLVKDGVMYVTGPDQVCALDAQAGREIWCYTRARNAAGREAEGAFREPNRGVALLGARLFFATSDAHLLCLNAVTGGVMWDVRMPESDGRYSATSAPLVIGDLVVSGIAGGDGPLRGFLAAYKVTTGEQIWRFWTIPKRGEPGSETWDGSALETGGAATWFTGSYDAETGTLFWATGNPYPATDGDERKGTNLYSNCVLALDSRTGKLRWYFQFTPHDLHDWDATEPLLLVDTPFRGRERKLLLQANRTGFFYVLDRTNGELLNAKPFVKKLTWASGIGSDGKPRVSSSNETSKRGSKTCPAVRGATNWYSTSYHPGTRLFYIMAVEDCSIYRQSQNGGYEGYRDPSDPGKRFLRAMNIETGEIAWEIAEQGAPESNYSGVLTTATGLLFYGEGGGSFAAVNAQNGQTLWHFNTGAPWKASPMMYGIRGKQYVAIAAGGNILSFALPDE